MTKKKQTKNNVKACTPPMLEPKHSVPEKSKVANQNVTLTRNANGWGDLLSPVTHGVEWVRDEWKREVNHIWQDWQQMQQEAQKGVNNANSAAQGAANRLGQRLLGR